MVILLCCKQTFILNSASVSLPGTFSDLYTKLHGPAATKRLCSNMFSSLAMDSSFSTLVHNYISSLSFKEVSIPTTKRISPLHVRVNNKLCFSMDFFSFTSGRNGSSWLESECHLPGCQIIQRVKLFKEFLWSNTRASKVSLQLLSCYPSRAERSEDTPRIRMQATSNCYFRY